jgi:hypothetical protein
MVQVGEGRDVKSGILEELKKKPRHVDGVSLEALPGGSAQIVG